MSLYLVASEGLELDGKDTIHIIRLALVNIFINSLLMLLVEILVFL